MNSIKIEENTEEKKSIGKQLYNRFYNVSLKNPSLYNTWVSGFSFAVIVVFGTKLCEYIFPAVIEFHNEYLVDHTATEEDIFFAYLWFFVLGLIMFIYTTYMTLKLMEKKRAWEMRDIVEEAYRE